MNITIHTDPALGASHATVHGDLGETVARFFGADCCQNAQLYVAAFKAFAGLQIMAGAMAWSVERHNSYIEMKMWHGNGIYQCSRLLPDTPTPDDVLRTISDAAQGVMNLIAIRG